jgi:voltage-gated potassium channel
MSALGLLFLVVVLGQTAARTGTGLHTTLVAATWLLWAVFAAEYVLRLAIAPSKMAFLRRTWWQLLLLAVAFLTMIRSLLILRAARPTGVAVAALRGSRSASASLTGRGGWAAVVTAIVVFAAAAILYRTGAVTPYGAALHRAALGAIAGKETGGQSAVAQLLDVGLALYAVGFFASLAGMAGAYFVERNGEARRTLARMTELSAAPRASTNASEEPVTPAERTRPGKAPGSRQA